VVPFLASSFAEGDRVNHHKACLLHRDQVTSQASHLPPSPSRSLQNWPKYKSPARRPAAQSLANNAKLHCRGAEANAFCSPQARREQDSTWPKRCCSNTGRELRASVRGPVPPTIEGKDALSSQLTTEQAHEEMRRRRLELFQRAEQEQSVGSHIPVIFQ